MGVHEMLVIASSMSARAISMEDVCQEEMSLLTAMDFEIDLPTPVAWFRMFLVRFDILTWEAHRETIQNICGDGDLCIEKCVSAASLSASFGPKKNGGQSSWAFPHQSKPSASRHFASRGGGKSVVDGGSGGCAPAKSTLR